MNKIRVELENGQGLGNQLWNIASAYCVAEFLGYELIITSFAKFKGNDFLSVSQDVKTSNEAAIERLPIFFEKNFHDTRLNYSATYFDDEVKNINQSVELKGLFQSEDYLTLSSTKLSDIFLLNEYYKEISKQFSNSTVLNIRGGEYKRHKDLILPREYWKHGIENIKKIGELGELIIVTDDKRYARLLFPEIPVITGDVGLCYAALYGAKNLVVSNSSFSYFPIMTRENVPMVIAPAFWARPNNYWKIWASPCNYYPRWRWMSSEGSFLSNEEAGRAVQHTINRYEVEFKTLHRSQLRKPPGEVSLYVKSNIKKVLSMFFPSLY